MTYQDIKDTFYATLRDRIATLNPARTIVLRGALRPAVIVAENELPEAHEPIRDCFVLHWSEPRQQNNLLSLACEIAYTTTGTQAAAGMDRGRACASMDAELLVALTAPAEHADGFSVSEAQAGAAVRAATQTRIFWSDLGWAATGVGVAVEADAQLVHKAAVEVFGYA